MNAILYPRHRLPMLEAVVEEVRRRLPARATALLLPGDYEAWRIWCGGEGGLRAWIEERLRDSYDETVAALSEKCPRLRGMSPVISPVGEGGLWLVWPYAGVNLDEQCAREFSVMLAQFAEVEHLERLHLAGGETSPAPALEDALRRGDMQALPELLRLTRRIGGADLSYWGSVRHGVVEVEWSEGALDGGFGFELPLGEGVGGRAFAGEREIFIPDYRNCQYRYPVVSDITDSEEVRSTLAIPIHGPDTAHGAVLYLARREIRPFSQAERAVLLRLGRSLEPVGRMRSAPGGGSIAQARSALRRLMLHANAILDLEEWVEGFIRGPAMVMDTEALPSIRSNLERMETLNEEAQVLPFEDQGSALWMWPTVELPPRGWTDFLEDLSATATVVLGRVEHAHQRIGEQRSRWLRDIEESSATTSLRREGNNLGLPVDGGEVWAVAWEDAQPHGLRLRMLAEETALDELGSPLILTEAGTGIILLKDGVRMEPSAFRDELLKHFAPSPLWLAHGACYRSFAELGEQLRRATQTAARARSEQSPNHVLKVRDRGLDTLMHRPGVRGTLTEFAGELLDPLVEHDFRTGSDLTRTFCRTLTLGSHEKAARDLFVHPNTVRYRVKRAGEILECDLSAPEEKTALTLAAFVWLENHGAPKPPAR